METYRKISLHLGKIPLMSGVGTMGEMVRRVLYRKETLIVGSGILLNSG